MFEIDKQTSTMFTTNLIFLATAVLMEGWGDFVLCYVFHPLHDLRTANDELRRLMIAPLPAGKTTSL